MQVERMRPSRMPGWWRRVRVASARRAGGDGEALADLDGRGVVVDAEEDETSLCRLAHGAVNLWTAENWLAAQTARTTRKTKLER